MRLSLLALALATTASAADPWLSYPGGDGPGRGKRVVLVSGDEEYRSEESLPMLAKLLANRYGFQTTVLFAIDPKDGTVNPNALTNIPGLDKLDDADVLVLLIRMRKLPPEQMKHFETYFKAGKPVVGLRTATHAFATGGDYEKWAWTSKVPGFEGGFGRVVLGETWVAHHGAHGKEGTRGIAPPDRSPILNGVEPGSVFGESDVYRVGLPVDCHVVLLGQVTKTLQHDSPPVVGPKNTPLMPLAWTKDYTWDGGKPGRAFVTTLGASSDFAHEGTRRLAVNAVFWALGMDVPAKADVTPIGDYKPTKFGFKKDAEWKPGKPVGAYGG